MKHCGQLKDIIYEEHKGHKIFIVRYNHLNPKIYNRAINDIKYKYNDQWYPVWRLFFFLIHPMAKYVNFGKVICSELTSHYLHLIGARHGQYYGTDVDKLSDEFIKRYMKAFCKTKR